MNITNILLFVLGGTMLGALITLGLQWFLNWKVSQGEVSQQLIESLVEAAEKIYEGKGRGKEKLAWVLGVLYVEAEKLGVVFDVDAITEIIDAYVEKVFNTEGIGEPEL